MATDAGFSDSGKILKMECDYSATCDEKIPMCKKMVKASYRCDILLE